MRELWDRVTKYFRFNGEEIKAIIFSSLIIAIVFALRKWQNATVGDFVSSLIIVLLSIIFAVSVQKIVALHIGFSAEYNIWWYGLFISIVVAIISQGKIWWLILPGGVTFSFMARFRLGKFRYGLNMKPMGVVGFVGPIAAIALGSLFKNIEIYLIGSSIPFLHSIYMFNLAFAVATMIPIPPLNGHYMFFASRPWFAFLFGTIFAYTILTLVFEVFSWIWALTLGGIIWLIYWLSFEKTAWNP